MISNAEPAFHRNDMESMPVGLGNWRLEPKAHMIHWFELWSNVMCVRTAVPFTPPMSICPSRMFTSQRNVTGRIFCATHKTWIELDVHAD